MNWQSQFFVLIETSWNVKKTEKTSAKATARVLIETSWNVKMTLSYGITALNEY